MPDQLPREPTFTVRCPACGRSFVATLDDVNGYLWDGWPACCGHAMLMSPADTPPPDQPGASGDPK